MSKKHFIAFAEYIKNLPVKQYGAGERQDMAEMVAKIAIQDNPNFDRARFFKALRYLISANKIKTRSARRNTGQFSFMGGK